MPFVSIQLNSNRPEQITRFFDSIEQTADHPADIEVLLHIDAGDTAMETLVARDKRRRKFTLKILQTDIVKGYGTLWMPLNPLFQLTHPDVYFVVNVSDEMLFVTPGWDSMLRPYIGYYPDHIFRLRASNYRYRNYLDVWECGFAPDSLAFYTRKWLALQGDWNPCLGPDSFQQCVAFYMYTYDPFSHRQPNRDIVLPFMRFQGEGASVGLSGEALYKRMCINNRAWFTLMSHRIQQEAKRRAMLLIAHILAAEYEQATLVEPAPRGKAYIIRDAADGGPLKTLRYRLSWLRVTFTLIRRAPFVLYYAGGGRDHWKRSVFSSTVLMLAAFTPLGTWILGKGFQALSLQYRIRGVMHRYGFLGIFTLAELALKPLVPLPVQRRFRKPYSRYRRRVRVRLERVQLHGRRYGRFFGICALLRSVPLLLLPRFLGPSVYRLRKWVHHYGNHAKSSFRHHGPLKASVVLCFGLLHIPLLPALKLLRRFKTHHKAHHIHQDDADDASTLQHISNHIIDTLQYHGVLKGAALLCYEACILCIPASRRMSVHNALFTAWRSAKRRFVRQDQA